MLFCKTSILKSYTDQTGRCPIPSSRGNHYIFILFHLHINSIHAAALPNPQAASIHDAWESLYLTILKQGHPPDSWQWMLHDPQGCL